MKCVKNFGMGLVAGAFLIVGSAQAYEGQYSLPKDVEFQDLDSEQQLMFTKRHAIAQSIARAETLIGNALAVATSNSVQGPGKSRLTRSLASAKTFLGNATAIATSNTISRGGWLNMSRSLASASTEIGNALAIARSTSISSGGVNIAISVASAVSLVGNATAIAQSNAG